MIRNSTKNRSTYLAAAILILAFSGVFASSKWLESAKPQNPEGFEDEALVFRGETFKDFSMGLNGLIADWYWMRSLQYLGGKLAKKPDVKINVNDLREFDPKLLYPLLDNSVNFDPHFIAVYEYGAVVLPAVDPAKAVELVKKGIRENPAEWRLYNHLGYIYWKTGNYSEASDAYSAAAAIDGAPELMRSMAAKMKSDAGSRQTAREIYNEIYENARDDRTRQTAKLNLFKLDSLDEIDVINRTLKSKPACPRDVREILPELAKIAPDLKIDRDRRPVDGGGTPYVFNPQTCSVKLDREKTTLPID